MKNRGGKRERGEVVPNSAEQFIKHLDVSEGMECPKIGKTPAKVDKENGRKG